MCGIVALQTSARDCAVELYQALSLLQHRGQDAAGLMISDGETVYQAKGLGLIPEAISLKDLPSLKGQMGIGHVRYPTTGALNTDEIQPFYVNAPLGLALAHNGHLVNAASLRAQFRQQTFRHINTASDSELILNVFAHALMCEMQSGQAVGVSELMRAVSAVMQQCQGGYAVVLLIVGYGILAFRDPFGIRPLVWGQKVNDAGDLETMCASESVALTAAGFTLKEDCPPRGAVFIDCTGHVFRHIEPNGVLSPCVFEYIYLARQDSVLNGVSVYQARRAMGHALAEQIQEKPWLNDVDVIMPVPETSRPAASALAQRLKISYREGLVKNPYIMRTFIMSGQINRQHCLRQKLNPLPEEFSGRHVCLVDDSIVRGNTALQVVAMAKQAGARAVSLLSLSPAIKFANFYGIDMPSVNDLIAHRLTLKQMRDALEVEGLEFLEYDRLKRAIQELGPHIEQFEDSVFTGQYRVEHEDITMDPVTRWRIFSDQSDPVVVSAV